MSKAHEGSTLSIKTCLPVDEHTTFLAHYDVTDEESLRGIIPIQSIATLRPIEGKFGGGIAIEESTTNINPYANMGTWLGSGMTVENITSEWERHIRITTTSTSTVYNTVSIPCLEDREYTFSFYARLLSSEPISHSLIDAYVGNTTDVITTTGFGGELTKEWKRFVFTGTTPIGTTNLSRCTIRIRQPLQVEIANWQLEQKPFDTSFVNGSRSTGMLRYPKEVVNTTEGTINCWIYVDPNGPHSSARGWAMAFAIVETTANPYSERNQISLRKVENSLNWRYYLNNDNANATSLTIGMPSRGWHMFTITWKNNIARAFLDGIVVAETTVATTPTTFDRVTNNCFHIGSWTNGMTINTIIDEFRIDKVMRSNEEILQWYNSQSPFYPKGVHRIYL